MKYRCYQESSVIQGWFVYWVLVEKCLSKSEPISDGARIKRFLRLHIVINPLSKKINIINYLLC